MGWEFGVSDMFTLGATAVLECVVRRQADSYVFLPALMKLTWYMFCSLVMQKKNSNFDCSHSGWMSELAMTNYEGVGCRVQYSGAQRAAV